jgi:hypothetical protein
MADASLRLAVRHRLGLLPYESLSRQSCHCRFRTRFTDDPDHFHSCEKFKRTFLTQRHNNLVQVVQDLAINAGFMAIREPNAHVRPEGIAEQAALSKDYNRHADLLLLRHDLKLYVDVTVVRPTRASTLHAQARSVSTLPLTATRAPASWKHSKYDEIARVNGYRMVPFVVESYGGIGAEANTLLHTLASHSKELSPQAFLLHAHKRLSVALQSSNANVAQLAMQQFHLHQHQSSRSGYDYYQQKVREEKLRYAIPEDGDRLARRVSYAITAAAAEAAELEEDAKREEEQRDSFIHAHRVCFADVSRTISLQVAA